MDLAWTDVTAAVMDRVSGPLRFRLILQPAMAAFFAVRAGLADVRDGKSPYFSMLVRDASDRRELAASMIRPAKARARCVAMVRRM